MHAHSTLCTLLRTLDVSGRAHKGVQVLIPRVRMDLRKNYTFTFVRHNALCVRHWVQSDLAKCQLSGRSEWLAVVEVWQSLIIARFFGVFVLFIGTKSDKCQCLYNVLLVLVLKRGHFLGIHRFHALNNQTCTFTWKTYGKTTYIHMKDIWKESIHTLTTGKWRPYLLRLSNGWLLSDPSILHDFLALATDIAIMYYTTHP